MKKAFNIFSYVLNIALIAVLAYTYCVGGNPAGSDRLKDIKYGIVENERADIPMKIQNMEHVYGITIDSLVLTNNVEPYSGYLVTTWDLDERQNLSALQYAANGYRDWYVRKTKTVFVEISNITTKGRKMNWNDNWGAAYVKVIDAE